MRKYLLALVLVASMATSASALTIGLECVGLMGGDHGLAEVDMSTGTILPKLGAIQATAMYFGITDALTVAIGYTDTVLDKDFVSLYTGVASDDPMSVSGLYVNAYYRILQFGNVASSVGVEAATVRYSAIKISADTFNIMYRATAKVLGDIAIIADLELLSNGYVVKEDSAGAVDSARAMTSLEYGKVGLSIPLMNI